MKHKKKVNLLKLITDVVDENQKHMHSMFPYQIDDFKLLQEYQNQFENKEEIELRNFSIFCYVNSWKILSEAEFKNNEKGNFNSILTKKLSEIIFSFNLLIQTNKIDEAFAVFRMYIELTSIFFASSIDNDVFKDYTKDDLNTEYLTHWFKKLKPSIIVKKRSEEHTSELQSRGQLVCRLLL